MTDPLFKQFLISRVETLKNELADTTLEVDTVIEKASEIKKIQSRIQKIENPPVRRKPEVTEAEAA